VLSLINDAAPFLLRNNAGGAIIGWCALTGGRRIADAVGARVTYQAGDLKRNRHESGGGVFCRRMISMVLGLGKHLNRLAGM